MIQAEATDVRPDLALPKWLQQTIASEVENVAHPQTSSSSRDIHNKKINRRDVLFKHMITQWVQKNLSPLPGQIFIGRKGLRPPELKRHR